jgi:hypothetical protein
MGRGARHRVCCCSQPATVNCQPRTEADGKSVMEIEPESTRGCAKSRRWREFRESAASEAGPDRPLATLPGGSAPACSSSPAPGPSPRPSAASARLLPRLTVSAAGGWSSPGWRSASTTSFAQEPENSCRLRNADRPSASAHWKGHRVIPSAVSTKPLTARWRLCSTISGCRGCSESGEEFQQQGVDLLGVFLLDPVTAVV